MHIRKFTEVEILDIIEKYTVKKLSSRKIGKLYNIEHKKILDLLQENNIARRSKNKRSYFNENYFENIDTEDKAYFLGFILADGCIYEDLNKNNDLRNWQKQMLLGLHVSDAYILEIFRNKLNLTKKIKFGNTRPSAILSVTSNKFCGDLLKLGISPRKSLTADFPNLELIPIHLIHHFIRGLFDGDGCITRHEDTNVFGFDICGTFNVCRNIGNIFSKIVVELDKDRKPYQQGKIFRQYYHKIQSLKNIYNYLYKDATIFLTRKQEKFVKIFDHKIKRLKPYDLPETIPVYCQLIN